MVILSPLMIHVAPYEWIQPKHNRVYEWGFIVRSIAWHPITVQPAAIHPKCCFGSQIWWQPQRPHDLQVRQLGILEQRPAPFHRGPYVSAIRGFRILVNVERIPIFRLPRSRHRTTLCSRPWSHISDQWPPSWCCLFVCFLEPWILNDTNK